MALEFHELEISERVEAKINSRHGVTADDVIDALGNAVNSEWDEDEERGRRLYVWGEAGDRMIFVCLWPIDEKSGEWRLVTAYPDKYP